MDHTHHDRRPATGLSNGVTYRFRVAAINEAGTGANLRPKTAKPKLSVPTVPQALTATVGSGQVRLNWLAPSNDGGADILGYTVQQSTNGISWTTLGITTETAYTATGLTTGGLYRFRVLATNLAGTGPATPPKSATPA